MHKIQRYVSNELTHFVGRGKKPEEQYMLLVNILNSGWLTHPPHNPNIIGNILINPEAKLSTNEMYSPQAVCFCDIPVEDIQIHTSKYSCFGLSLSKQLVAQQGGTPVLYLPRNARVHQPHEHSAALLNIGSDEINEDVGPGQLFDRMIPEYDKLCFQIPAQTNLELMHFLNFHLLSYVKFFESNLADDDPENLYMEREWRVVGNARFALEDVIRIFVPQEYSQRFRADFPGFSGQINLT
jgi:Putative abortive phage resistance protein AbiGi, antitoxin